MRYLHASCRLVDAVELPSTRGLQALAVLRQAPSLTSAAASLGVTRSALSHRIAELERHLGVTLVRRSGRRAVLTDDAQAILSIMGDALDRIEAAVEPLRRRRGQLRISTVATFASLWLIPRLPDWQQRHPGIELAIATTTRPVGFETEDFDCAIRHGVGGWQGLEGTLLFRETLVPVAHPDIAELSVSSTLIRARSRYRDWNRWWKMSGSGEMPPTREVVVENRAQAMDAALAGAGIAVMDKAYIASHLENGRLQLRGVPSLLPEGYFLVTPSKGKGRADALKHLKAWLIEHGQRCQ